MAKVIFKNDNGLIYTPIPNSFIDECIPGANPAYVTVYILTLRNCLAGIPLDTAFISSALGLLESDVINAWKYWRNKGIMSLTENEGAFEIEFLNLYSCGNGAFSEEGRKKIPISSKPSYTPETISAFSENKDIKAIYDMAENLFAKQLDFNDMSVLTELYEWLMLPLDVIAVLLTYCAKKGKNMRYVEKTAIDWAEKEIISEELAEEYISLFENKYFEIMKAMGISSRDPTGKEKNFMNKWVMKLKMPLDIIKEACERAVMNTGKTSFAYADKIVEEWYRKNIKTLDDIKVSDEEYSKQKSEETEKEKANKKSPSKQAKSKFVNYEQSGYDYDKLAKLERELLEKELKED